MDPDRPPAAPTAASYTEVEASEEFGELRRSYRGFAFPLTVAFIAWYLLYVLLSNYAGGFMGAKLVGNVNVALVFGLAQFASTFAIAIWYSRHANAKLDPRANAIKARMESAAPEAGTAEGRAKAPENNDSPEGTA